MQDDNTFQFQTKISYPFDPASAYILHCIIFNPLHRRDNTRFHVMRDTIVCYRYNNDSILPLRNTRFKDRNLQPRRMRGRMGGRVSKPYSVVTSYYNVVVISTAYFV